MSQEIVAREKEYWEAQIEFEWLTEAGVRAVIERMPPLEGDVLELCSGSGMFTRRLPRTERSYTCLDLSEPLLRSLQQALPHIRTLTGDAQELDLPPASFDAVLVFAGLHHLPEYERAIQAAFRVLRPGGMFLCFEPNAECWYRRFMLSMRGWLQYTADERFLPSAEILEHMRAAGFIELEAVYLTPRPRAGHHTWVGRLLTVPMMLAARISPVPAWQSFFLGWGRKP